MNRNPEPDDMPTTVDVIRYPIADEPVHKAVPPDDGPKVVGAHDREVVRRKKARLMLFFGATVVLGGIGAYAQGFGAAVAAAIVVLSVFAGYEYLRSDPTPEVVDRNVHAEEAAERYDLEEYVEEVFVEEN